MGSSAGTGDRQPLKLSQPCLPGGSAPAVASMNGHPADATAAVTGTLAVAAGLQLLAAASLYVVSGKRRRGDAYALKPQKQVWPVEAKDSALCLTPRSMSRDIRKSAGTMRSQPPSVNHHGAVFHLDRNRKRVRWPPSIGAREKAQVQSSVALCRCRQLAGRWEVECSANDLCGSRRSTMKPHSVSGAPSGMKAPR